MGFLLLIAAILFLMIIISDIFKPKNPTGLPKQPDFEWDVQPYVGGAPNALAMEQAARARGFKRISDYIRWRDNPKKTDRVVPEVTRYTPPVQPPKESFVVTPDLALNCTVRITYEDSEGNLTQRTIDIKEFYEDTMKWKAWCHLRKDMRHFFVEKVRSIDLVEIPSPEDCYLPKEVVKAFYRMKPHKQPAGYDEELV